LRGFVEFFYQIQFKIEGVSDLSISREGTLANLYFTSLKAGSTSLTFKLVKTRGCHNKEIVTTKRSIKLKSK